MELLIYFVIWSLQSYAFCEETTLAASEGTYTLKPEPSSPKFEYVTVDLVCCQPKGGDAGGRTDFNRGDSILKDLLCRPRAPNVDVYTDAERLGHQNHGSQSDDCTPPLAPSSEFSDNRVDQGCTTDDDGVYRHDVEKPYRCDFCGYRSRYSSNLARHVSRHTGERPFLCEVCGRAFTSVDILKNHQITHSSVRAFTCDICQKSFKHKQCLKYHAQIHSNEEPFSCDICQKTFKQKVYFEKHTRTHDNQGLGASSKACQPRGVPPCYTCGRSFSSMGNLKRHMKMHTSEGTLQCSLCHKYFQRDYLAQHMKIHERLPYWCEKCSKKFSRRDELTLHRQEHREDGGEFLCSFCGKRYKLRGYLTRHCQIEHSQSSSDKTASTASVSPAYGRVTHGTEYQELEEPIKGEQANLKNEASIANLVESQKMEYSEENLDNVKNEVVENLVAYQPKEEAAEYHYSDNGEYFDVYGMPAHSSRTQEPSSAAVTNTATRMKLETRSMNSCEAEIDIKDDPDFIKKEEEISEYALYLLRCEEESNNQLSE